MKLGRYFWLTALSLVFGFFGVIVLSHVPRGVTAPSDVEMGRVANMASFESTDSNGVEVDGIRFETLVPETVWTIPESQPGASTPVQLGIRMINNRSIPVQFNRLDPLFFLKLQMQKPDNQVIQKRGGSRDRTITDELDCPSVVLPGNSKTFFLYGRLFWENNKLQLGGSDGFGGIWYFDDLKAGTYKFRFIYQNSRPVTGCYDPEIKDFKRVEGLWMGQVATPFVEVRLVQS